MRLEIDPVATEFPLNATPVYEHASETTSWDYESVLRKGIAAAQSGDRDGARKLLSQVTAINPSSEDAWMWLASISDYPEELLAFLNRVLEINPENDRATEWRLQTNALLAKTFVQRALAARNDGSTELARQYVTQALSHDERCESAWFWKASLADSDDEKLEIYSRLLHLNPEHDEAASEIESIHRQRTNAALDRAQQHLGGGEMVEARDAVRNLLSHNDVLVREKALLIMADAAETEDDRLEFYEQVLQLNPDNGTARCAIENHRQERLASAFAEARAAAASGDSAAALTMLSDLLDQDPNSVEAWLLYSHLSTGFNEKVDALQRVLQIDPKNSAARSGLQYLEQTFGVSSTATVAEPVEQADAIEPPPFTVVDEPEDTFHESDHSPYRQTGLSESVEFALRPTEDALDVSDVEMSTEEAFEPEQSYDRLESAAIDEYLAVAADDTELSPFDAKVDSAPDERVEGHACPFCAAEVNAQAFSCEECNSMLTLADMERLLSGVRVDRDVVQQAVTAMEAEWNYREFNENEFVTLGLGHMNLGNFDSAFRYLQEAARLNPNNVILSGHINTLAIRLEEMRRQSEVFDAMPKGKTILVVDDSATVRKLIAGKLEKSGHHVVCAVDGVEALERLEEELPDLVLLDITMPRMDGYEVCKQIRANPAAKDLPVVMISGKDGFFDKVRGRMAGTTGYVTKPFGPETLMKALETYLLPDMVEAEQ